MSLYRSKTIADLRAEGFAVVVFSPEELGFADRDDVQSALVSEGNDVIERLQPDLATRLDLTFQNQFMKPEVFFGPYFEVETSIGTEVVQCSSVGNVGQIEAARLVDFLVGVPDAPNGMLISKTGWLARLSAPGHMDSTDWTVHESGDGAAQYLIDTYGE